MSQPVSYPRVAALKTAPHFLSRLAELGIALPSTSRWQSGRGARWRSPRTPAACALGNRWCILPMEGWDGTIDGHPTDLTRRRWTHFGRAAPRSSGAAKRSRCVTTAAPTRTSSSSTTDTLSRSRRAARHASSTRIASNSARRTTCSSACSSRTRAATRGPTTLGPGAPRRVSPPRPRSRASASPTTGPVFTDDGARSRWSTTSSPPRARAADAGFAFVDIKHCHGYLGHELLSARHRPGKYGGSFENRTAVPAEHRGGHPRRGAGAGNRRAAVGLRHGAVQPGPGRRRRARGESASGYDTAFGLHAAGAAGDIDDADALPPRACRRWASAGSALSAGSPYYNPHIQRPAIFPPSDGYLPPEDPLVGVARQIAATAALKARHPELVLDRLRLQLPAGVAAARGRARDPSRPGRRGRPGAHGPELPGPAGRHARRAAAQDEAALPHVQRLHDGAAQRPGLGLLPAGPVLREAPGRRAAEADQEER